MALVATLALTALTVGATAGTPDCTKIKEMNPDRFWSLVDQTVDDDESVQISAMRAALSPLSPNEIVGFFLTYYTQRERAYSWDLWGAASIANGGASDDGFEYFRDWLVSRGRRTFERVRADPDGLADAVPANRTQVLEFEEFGSVAPDLWVAKTGRDYETFSELQLCRTVAPRSNPSGTRFFGPGAPPMSQRYPKLWRRFRKTPLL